MQALREGADPDGLERAMVRYGFPLGPLAMMDDVGIDVGAKIETVLADALRARGSEPDPASATLVAAGYLGRKAGKGFYRYEDGKRQEIDPEAMRLAGFSSAASTALSVGPTASEGRPPVESGTALAERLAFTIVREAILCLEEGVLRSPRDGDLGAVFGFGFPPFRGGPLYLVDQRGAPDVVEKLRALEARHGGRFAPPASLLRLAEEDGRFHP
jgi:3-hydroxyacyl-CoA dehydrogenase / enoyl-CoA hydratase / 3-hydroxybutyryl-CoA epimerase